MDRIPAKAKTDAGGAFVLENCKPGRGRSVTVQAEGFAPDLREVHPEDQPALEFLLGPAHTVRGQVVDRNGKPVAGATIYPETWRAHRTLEFRADTGPDGRFEWRERPGDVVLFSISKAGYISRRDVALPPTGAIQVITLDPELVISGRVTDAATGRPVPAFRLIRGLVFSNKPRAAGEGTTANLTALIRGIVSANNPRPPGSCRRPRRSPAGATPPSSTVPTRATPSASRPKDTSRPIRASSGPARSRRRSTSP